MLERAADVDPAVLRTGEPGTIDVFLYGHAMWQDAHSNN